MAPDLADRRPGTLPASCYVVLPGLPAGANVAVCVLGEQGVRLTRLNLGETEEARVIVRAFNATLGIDAVAERVMIAGCLRGWSRNVVGGDGAGMLVGAVGADAGCAEGRVLH